MVDFCELCVGVLILAASALVCKIGVWLTSQRKAKSDIVCKKGEIIYVCKTSRIYRFEKSRHLNKSYKVTRTFRTRRDCSKKL